MQIKNIRRIATSGIVCGSLLATAMTSVLYVHSEPGERQEMGEVAVRTLIAGSLAGALLGSGLLTTVGTVAVIGALAGLMVAIPVSGNVKAIGYGALIGGVVGAVFCGVVYTAKLARRFLRTRNRGEYSSRLSK